MLPIATEDIANEIFEQVFGDVKAWQKEMIHYIKDENPEINAAIIEAAKKTSHDPKAVALGAYLVYKILEKAAEKQNQEADFI